MVFSFFLSIAFCRKWLAVSSEHPVIEGGKCMQAACRAERQHKREGERKRKRDKETGKPSRD